MVDSAQPNCLIRPLKVFHSSWRRFYGYIYLSGYVALHFFRLWYWLDHCGHVASTGYIRRYFGYLWQIALGLLLRRGWATVVVVVRHMLLTLAHLLVLLQQLPVAVKMFCNPALDDLKLLFHLNQHNAFDMVRLGFLWVMIHRFWVRTVCCYQIRLYCGTRCFDAPPLPCFFPLNPAAIWLWLS
jgi:hypothetical protein